ncbi:MAG: hypothetical protein K6C94_09045 [Candidatus Gastranaerophilales bacterium]|nr:hypothetical protein [Candidatus Gastranaerophilales bacterium]
MKKVKRKNKTSVINDLTEAQKFIFAPLAFQAVSAMLEFGIFDFLDKNPASKEEIMRAVKADEYTVTTLLQIAAANNLVREKDNMYSLTKKGLLFIYDDMTKANFNFVKDVCYLGASEMYSSFKERAPKGLQKFVGNYKTIYPVLTLLPDKMLKSWYEFDHFYSDNCFDEILEIISKSFKNIYDIGGNTGKLEALCLSKYPDISVTMFDLPENLEKIKTKKELQKCNFHPIDVLSENPDYPEFKDSAIIMSQFLDCFSKQDIVKILKDLTQKADDKTSIFILEPYTDMQNFEGAEYSIVHSSLYFTCMANGVSKFYTMKEMEELIGRAGLTIKQCCNGIGAFDYTLLECGKNAVVSG